MTRTLGLALALSTSVALAEGRYFRLEIVDSTNQAPLPGALVETTNHLRFTSDRNGLVAFHEPGVMGTRVWFTVTRSGYQVAPDALGIRGVGFVVNEGGTGRIAMVRDMAFDAGPVPAVSDVHSRLLEGGAFVPDAGAWFRIDAIDAESQRGVPLVSFTSSYGEQLTDSAGVLAFLEPDAMGKPLTFSVKSHGFLIPDGGVITLTPTAGGRATVTVQRELAGERLYRITGGGVYRDSVVLGLPVPTARPLLNGRVFGQDSVLSTLYRGQAFYVWGDTNRPDYPLGNFYSSAATSKLPDAGGLAPSVGIDLTYLTDDAGFVKQMAPIETQVSAPVWLGSLTTVTAEDGGEALFASYAKVRSDLSAMRRGIVRYDDATRTFAPVVELPVDGGAVLAIDSHTSLWHSADGGVWVLSPPVVRAPATAAGLSTPAQWEAFTAKLQDGGFERDVDGGYVYAWRAATRRTERAEVPAAFAIDGHARELGPNRAMSLHGNDDVAWNPWRRRFVRFASETNVVLGDLFLQEADTPMGPWVFARRIVKHQRYTFYNPRHHRFFDEEGGRRLYVEGTYTAWLTSTEPTTRYDYNQVMYRVDLADERLALPVPVYAGEVPVTKRDLPADAPPVRPVFFAFDRPGSGRVPISVDSVCEHTLTTAELPGVAPLFYGAAPDAGAVAVAVAGTTPVLGWPSPTQVALPVADFLAEGLAVNAGPDVCLRTGGALTLKANAVAANGPVALSWKVGTVTRTGPNALFVLRSGLHQVELTATDALGRQAFDRVLVEVLDGADGGASGGGTGASGGGETSTGGGSLSSGGGEGDPAAQGCGCHGALGAMPFGLALLWLRRRRKL